MRLYEALGALLASSFERGGAVHRYLVPTFLR